jgi:hypothetical protein
MVKQSAVPAPDAKGAFPDSTPSTIASTPSESRASTPTDTGSRSPNREGSFGKMEEPAELESRLLEKCKSAWDEHGRMPRHLSGQCALLTVRYCHELAILNWPCCRVVLTCIRMLAECGYDFRDIEVVFATGLATCKSARSVKYMQAMSGKELLLVSLLHLYCAHSVVFDEFVHFKVWHEWLFAPFCSVRASENALGKICALRRWRFHVPQDVLQTSLEMLQSAERVSVPSGSGFNPNAAEFVPRCPAFALT